MSSTDNPLQKDEDTYKFGQAPPVYKEEKDGKQRELVLLTPDYAEYAFEKMFVNQELYGMPFTDGKWWSNFVMHMRNEHSILSCFFAHPNAPFSDNERQAFIFIYWSWNFILTVFFNLAKIRKSVNIILTNILMILVGKILREIMECTCCYNSGYEASGFKEAYTICFRLLELGASIQVLILGVVTLGMVIYAALLTRDGEHVADLETYLISQINSTITTEVAHRFVMSYFFFEKNKKAFEDRWAPYFAEGEAPVNITDVGKRAKENFLWDPIVYGRTAEYAIKLLEAQYELVGKENAARQKNGEASHNGYAIPTRETAEVNFENRWKDYDRMFNFQAYECSTGSRPPGIVDGVRPQKETV